MSEQHLLLVVGVGRSGTSLLSGMLGQLGFRIPQPEVKADDTNPRGFGEPRWVVDFHTRLLRQRRVTVNDARPAAWEATTAAGEEPAVRDELRRWLEAELGEPGAVLVKDPRTVWFLPLWMRCADELGARTSFVTMLRHPAEIVTSARRSYGPGLTEAGRAAAWINVILQTENVTREASRAFVRYEDLLADWPPEIRRLGALLDVPALAGTVRRPEVDGFVDPGLHRSRSSWEDLDVPAHVRDLAEAVWGRLEALAAPSGDTPAAHAALDADRVAYRALYGEAEAIAQCSVMAARPRKKSPAPPPSLPVRLARRVPAPYRRRLQRAVRKLRP
jgi:hypothetical protein